VSTSCIHNEARWIAISFIHIRSQAAVLTFQLSVTILVLDGNSTESG
jgi:hypothetical protein